MPPRAPWRFVIDTCVVAQAGSDDTNDPRSAFCHDFLLHIYSDGYCVALCEALLLEWREHMSPRARKWLSQMHGRKRVEVLDVSPDEPLRRSVLRTAANPGESAKMEKDCHLLETALAADQRIASTEVKSRRFFAKASRHVTRLNVLLWINPAMQDENVAGWLAAGAPSEEPRLLCNFER